MLVIRARSFEIFHYPQLLPRQDEQDAAPAIYNHAAARQHLGWIDGVSVMPHMQTSRHEAPSPLSIVVRAETDDPWVPIAESQNNH